MKSFTTPFTFVATAETIAISAQNPSTSTSTPHVQYQPWLIEAAITPRTKAILPRPSLRSTANMDPLLAVPGTLDTRDRGRCPGHGRIVQGRKVCSLGTVGCISFFRARTGVFRRRGMVVTNDASLAESMRVIAAHGSRVRYYTRSRAQQPAGHDSGGNSASEAPAP